MRTSPCGDSRSLSTLGQPTLSSFIIRAIHWEFVFFLLIAKDLSKYISNPCSYMSNDVSINALCSIHRAVGHLHRPGTNVPLDHPLSHLNQSRAGQDLAPIRAVNVFGSAPQDLCSRACSGPDHGVQVDRVSLLCPDMDFTTQDE